MTGTKEMVGRGNHQDVLNPMSLEKRHSKGKIFKSGSGTGLKPNTI
jgi:hypothetical protein